MFEYFRGIYDPDPDVWMPDQHRTTGIRMGPKYPDTKLWIVGTVLDIQDTLYPTEGKKIMNNSTPISFCFILNYPGRDF